MLEVFTSSLLFNPPERQALKKFRVDSKNCCVRSVDGDMIHCHLVCPWDKDTSLQDYTKSQNIIIFYHGNNEDISTGRSYCQWLADKTNMNVLTCDYPGYGYSTGAPSETGMKSAAFALLDYATSKLQHTMSEVFLLGKSIGSMPAVTLAAQPDCHNLGGLILVSPIASGIRCLSASTKLPKFILTELDTWVLPNIKHIADVTCPVQFIHGLEDNVVCCQNSHLLLAAMRCPTYTQPMFVKAGHNDIESKFGCLFINTLKDFFVVCKQRHDSQSAYEYGSESTPKLNYSTNENVDKPLIDYFDYL